MNDCVICLRPIARAVLMLCARCAKDYEKTDGVDMAGVIEWAAKRTRYFERRRK